jgi:hypothetical protein
LAKGQQCVFRHSRELETGGRLINMRDKEPTDFEKFDRVMRGLLAVPYQELQEELEKDRKAKAAKKKRAKKVSKRASSRDSGEA